MSDAFSQVPPRHVREAFAQIDELDTLAQACLTERQWACWQLLCENKDSEEIADALGITPKCARELRARVQMRVRQAQTDKHEGVFRCANVVADGNTYIFKDDETARDGIKNAEYAIRRQAAYAAA